MDLDPMVRQWRFVFAVLLCGCFGLSSFGCYQPSVTISPDITVSSLIRLLQDLDPVTRRTAAEALGKIGEHRALPNLLLAFEDPSPMVREAAVRSVRECGPFEATDGARVAGLLLDSASGVRTAAAQTLTSFEGMTDLWPKVLGHLDHDDPEIRLAVIQSLEGIEGPEVVTALKKSLADPDARVRRAAVVSLGQSGSSQAGGVLRERMIGDGSSDVRAEAAYHFQFVSEGDEGWDELKAVAGRDQHLQVRRWAEQTLNGLAKPLDSDSALQPVPRVGPEPSHRYP